MSSKVKNLVYWLTLVGPIVDVLHGAIVGIMNVWIEAKAERQHLETVRKYDEMLEKFRKDME